MSASARGLRGASALWYELGLLARLVLSGTLFVGLKRTTGVLHKVAGRRGCCTEGSVSSGRVRGATFLWCVLVLLARLVSLSTHVLACFWVFSWAWGDAQDAWLRAGSSWMRGKLSSELSNQFASLGLLGLAFCGGRDRVDLEGVPCVPFPSTRKRMLAARTTRRSEEAEQIW